MDIPVKQTITEVRYDDKALAYFDKRQDATNFISKVIADDNRFDPNKVFKYDHPLCMFPKRMI